MQPLNTELILIRVTGEDRPGLTASVTEILAKYDATILDIGQADIHNTLSLGILCKTEEQHSGFIMKELLFKASSLGVTIRFYPITAKEYEDWVSMQGKNRYILTLLGRKVVCPSDFGGDPYSGRARHEYRCHQAPYRAYSAGRMRYKDTRLH